jgi:hypothetical protein
MRRVPADFLRGVLAKYFYNRPESATKKAKCYTTPYRQQECLAMPYANIKNNT